MDHTNNSAANALNRSETYVRTRLACQITQFALFFTDFFHNTFYDESETMIMILSVKRYYLYISKFSLIVTIRA